MFFIQYKKILLLLSSIFFMNHGDLFSFFIWQFPPTSFSYTGLQVVAPQVAIDPFGNGIIVWYRNNGSRNVIQASRYDSSTNTWQAEQDLSDAAQSASNPKVAMDSYGNGMAVWSRSDGTNTIIQARRYDVGTNTWQAVQNLSAAGRSASFPQVAMDPLGNAIATWQRAYGTPFIIQASRYDNITTHNWDLAMNLTDSTYSSDGSAIAMDAAGNGIAVWRGTDGLKYIIRTRRYDNITTHTWQEVQDLSDTSQNAQGAQIAMDAVGNATVVWRWFDGAYDLAQAIRYDNVTTHTWQAVQTLSVTGQHAVAPMVAMGGVGNAIVVWGRVDVGVVRAQVSIYDVATGTWQAPQYISSAVGSSLGNPSVAMDQKGNGTVIWSRFITSYTMIQVCRYNNTATRAWSPAETISTQDKNSANPMIAMNPFGSAIAVWRHVGEATYFAQASLYKLQPLCVCCKIFAYHVLNP